MEREKREGENRLNHDTALLCVEGKLVAEIGMGDGDKLAGAGAERLTSEMGDAKLSNNVVNVVLAGGDDCAGLEDGLDSADGAVLRGGGESDKALTSSATTANPLPASPALAASIEAFKASRFV